MCAFVFRCARVIVQECLCVSLHFIEREKGLLIHAHFELCLNFLLMSQV